MRAAIDAAAAGLTTLTSTSAGIGQMSVDVLGPEMIRSALGGQLVQINLGFAEGVSGEHLVILPDSGALALFNLSTGQSGGEMTDMVLHQIGQTMDQMFAAAGSSLSARLGRSVRFNPARATQAHSNSELTLPGGASLVRFSFPLKLEGAAPVQMTQIMTYRAAKDIVNMVMGIGMDMSSFGPAAGGPMGGGFAGTPQAASGPMPGQIGVSAIQYPQLNSGMGQNMTNHNISMLMDVKMELSVELGRARKKISEILSLGEGSIIELNKLAGEPVDVLVNGNLIAKGEVVVIDENFGVRVTEIVSPKSRIEFNA
jgi:flagellar motor switch protein FliN/FliY